MYMSGYMQLLTDDWSEEFNQAVILVSWCRSTEREAFLPCFVFENVPFDAT